MNENTNFNYINLSPFKWFVLENFPYIEADFDALTNWQLFCKLGKEMNKIIEKVNLTGQQTEDLTKAFNELKNYVDNYFSDLNVQEQINKKLDEMAQTGELSNIITNLLKLNPILIIDTIEQIKNSSNFIIGNLIRTKGFYNINDGGSALYFIRSKNENEIINNITTFETQNNLVAQYIEENKVVNIKQFGCLNDGVFDNFEILQTVLDNFKNIIIDEGTFYSSQILNIYSNTSISGNGTLLSNISISGEIGETINTSSIEENKINTTHKFNINDLLLIFYEETEDKTNNKRQIVTTSSEDGKLSNNLCNFNNNYSVRLLNSVKNVNIDNITIKGTLRISYAQDIFINKITQIDGYLSISYSYNVNVQNSLLKLGNDKRIDCQRGSSNCNFENLKFLGGNTPSDNGALKLNQVFYSNVNNCNFGTPNRDVEGYTGYFHAFMIDGAITEDNYPNNPSQFINVSNCNTAKGFTNSYFITLGKNIRLNNIYGYKTQIKNSDNVSISNSNIDDLYNETNNNNIIISNTIINTITQGSRSNIKFINCNINDFAIAQNVHNVYLQNCSINRFINTFISNNSAYNIFIDNCEIFDTCQIAGINKGRFNIISHCPIIINQLYYADCNLLIIENKNDYFTNLHIQNSEHNRIFYDITEEAIANTPLNNLLTNDLMLKNIVQTINFVNSNNPDNNVTQSFVKSNNYPSDESRHYKGEIILSTNPYSTGFIGWVCVETGNPGRWKGFGVIS